MADIAVSLAVIASFLLTGFAIRGLWKGEGARQKYWLMIGVAVVTMINAYLLATMPNPG